MKKSCLFFCAIYLLSVVFTIFFGVKKLQPTNEQNISQNKSIIVLWHVDGFEGGTGSRKEFLLSVARKFEKQNSGVLVTCITHTKGSAENSMANGDFPHMISYSLGLKLSNYSNIESSYKFEQASLDKKTYALPWCRGNYYLFSHSNERVDLSSENLNDKRVIVSQTGNTMPLVSLCLEDYKIQQVETYSPLDAYVNFVADKHSILLGTQRDAVRLTNWGLDFNYKILNVFSDLYQYISITTDNNLINLYCQKFINLLFDENTQKGLNKICMASEYYSINQDINAIEQMNNNQPKRTVSPLVDQNYLSNISTLALNGVKGDKQATLNLKNIFNIP